MPLSTGIPGKEISNVLSIKALSSLSRPKELLLVVVNWSSKQTPNLWINGLWLPAKCPKALHFLGQKWRCFIMYVLSVLQVSLQNLFWRQNVHVCPMWEERAWGAGEHTEFPIISFSFVLLNCLCLIRVNYLILVHESDPEPLLSTNISRNPIFT